ncbi:MAG: hypothetical protein GY847_36840 [Proteobacteria bacterium]|nr:hypothetical protein [Pseudomonadota bacterium]
MDASNQKLTTFVSVYLISAWSLFSFACTDGTEDDDETSKDSDNDTGSDEVILESCEDIKWTGSEYYLAVKSIVARWQQTAYVDANANGSIDEAEEVDTTFDLLEMCESDKKSIVLLMGTDN